MSTYNVENINFSNPAKVTGLITAKGTVLTSTDGADVVQFPVGTNNQVIIADDTQPTGLRWTEINPDFGLNYSYTEFVAEQSTTVTYPSFFQAVRLTTPSLPAGNYRLIVYFNWRTNKSGTGFTVRVQLDDATTLLSMTGFSDVRSVQTPNVQDFYTGVKESITLNGVHNLDVDIAKATGASGTVWISNIHIEVFRVST